MLFRSDERDRRLEAAAVFFEFFFLAGETPGRVVSTGNRPTLDTGLGVLWPEESVEVVVRSFERSSLFEAPMSTFFHVPPLPGSACVTR